MLWTPSLVCAHTCHPFFSLTRGRPEHSSIAAPAPTAATHRCSATLQWLDREVGCRVARLWCLLSFPWHSGPHAPSSHATSFHNEGGDFTPALLQWLLNECWDSMGGPHLQGSHACGVGGAGVAKLHSHTKCPHDSAMDSTHLWLASHTQGRVGAGDCHHNTPSPATQGWGGSW